MNIDEGLEIARKQVNNFSHVHKFGSNPQVHDTNPETVWSQGGLYPWSALNNAETIYVLSTSGSDTAQVTVEGLDSNYNFITQTKTMSGSTAITLDSPMRRVFRMSYTDTTANAGTITARVTSASGTVVGRIDADLGSSLMALYSIPATQVGYLLAYTVSVEKDNDAQINLFVREFGQVFRLKSEVETYNNSFTQNFIVPLRLPPKTDLDFRAVSPVAGGKKVYLNFDLLLEDI